MLLATSQAANCSQAQSEYDNIDKYIKTTTTEEIGTGASIDHEPRIIEDKVVRDYFTNNKVRTLIMQETKNSKTVRTTTTYVTKNPTIYNWRNAAIGAGIIGTAAAAGLAYSSGVNLEEIQKYFGSAPVSGQPSAEQPKRQPNGLEAEYKAQLKAQEDAASAKQFGTYEGDMKDFQNSQEAARAQALVEVTPSPRAGQFGTYEHAMKEFEDSQVANS